LRAVADWYRQQADRLGEQLAESNGQLAGGNA
jgi:hypothetical protein